MSDAWLAMALRSATVNGNHDLQATQAADGEAGTDTSSDRYRSIVDIYVLLQRPDGLILLLERSGTGSLCPALEPHTGPLPSQRTH